MDSSRPKINVDDDYLITLFVSVKGYGKHKNEQTTISRVRYELGLKFGEENVRVDEIGTLRGKDARE